MSSQKGEVLGCAEAVEKEREMVGGLIGREKDGEDGNPDQHRYSA